MKAREREPRRFKKKRLPAISRVGILVLFCAVASSCVGSRASLKSRGKPGFLSGPGEPVVIIRSGDELVITWETRLGDVYSIVYKEGPGPHQRWLPLPGYSQIPGTGSSKTVRLSTWPGDQRRFNITSKPQGKSVDRRPPVHSLAP